MYRAAMHMIVNKPVCTIYAPYTHNDVDWWETSCLVGDQLLCTQPTF